jgi:hypothetical protein
MLSGAAFAAPLPGSPDSPDSRHLVSTPVRRAEYLKKMLHVLCTELGPRPACSRAFEAGALVIKREMERALPAVALDTFAVTGWELTAEPELRVGDMRIETYPAHSGPGTPEAGLRGVVRQVERQAGRFEIVGQPEGRVLARIYPGPFGPAVTTRYRGDDGIPRFSVGRQDVPRLDMAAREKLPVFVKAPVNRIPNCRTSNVAGTLPGASTDEILYVAHADTVYNGPGASDNTASMIAMLMLAHAMSGTRPKRTFTFLASAAEEMGSLGAAHYAETRKANGTLNRIKICVNLDSLTYGPNLQITTTDRELERMILDIHGDLGIRSEPKTFYRDDTMDSAPFKAAGARTVYFNSRGHDVRTLPLNHRPDDRADTIDTELIESSFRILLELTRRLDTIRI